MGTSPPPTSLKFHKIGEQLIPVTPTDPNESTISKGLLPYCFKVPTLEQSLGLLNGLCKFEDPLLRLQGSLKDWLLKLWVPPKPTVHSPKEWSTSLCLQVVKALLEAQSGTPPQAIENQPFHQFVWQWEQQQCKPFSWLKALWPADVAWQPWLHNTLLSLDEQTSSTLNRFFKANHLNVHWLDATRGGKLPIEEALWGALWEQHTLPWLTILHQGVEASQKTTLLTLFPYLNRLWEAYQANPLLLTQPKEVATNQRPVQKIILVEGQSERCLLPALGKALGTSFEAAGIWVIASGGKSATLQKCLGLLAWVNVPIAVLLDADAQAEAIQLNRLSCQTHPALSVWVLAEGELEDTYPLPWVYAVLEQLPVGQKTEASLRPLMAHGLPARIPTFEVFEAFVLEARNHGERASETFRRFWTTWGYPPFDKRELAEGIAKILPLLELKVEGNSLLIWLSSVIIPIHRLNSVLSSIVVYVFSWLVCQEVPVWAPPDTPHKPRGTPTEEPP